MNQKGAAAIDRLVERIRQGNRRSLAQAITLVESSRTEDQQAADWLLDALAMSPGDSIRVGISGPPGSGKSTLIESLGLHVIDQGHRPAVLAVDPSSAVSGGSILGDKSRMSKLAQADAAFIRPSPNALTLGGVARRTREVIFVAEAAGYDVVLVETVGAGQSEVEVSGMVDLFAALLLPGSGDELQGIKKGILEHADFWLVNKADGDNLQRAQSTLAEYRAAMGYSAGKGDDAPVTMTVSGLTGAGVDALWRAIVERQQSALDSCEFSQRRRRQEVAWVTRLARSLLLDRFVDDVDARELRERLEQAVERGELSARAAARQLVDEYLDS